MKIALVQQHATPDKTDDIARGLAAVDQAAVHGANVVVFAELAFERDRRPDLYASWIAPAVAARR